MSEAYECDRCGSLREGTPDTDVQVMEGEPRTGQQDDAREFHERSGTYISKFIFDLCPACRNDLRRWFREDGAEVTFPHMVNQDDE